MPNIHVLDQNTINKIAAGEVIERPASVVKELLENAIDAKATAVTVEIREGGISFIRVTDNGCGIEKEEIPLAFLRHSTSKIQSVEDLFTVSSLGFRGEALSSIAAVGQVELITKTSRSLTGNRYQIEGGQERGMEEIGAPDGTTFIVRNLFYNTPVRRKFLKTPMTEGAHVADLVEKIALSHPEISIRFIQNNQNKLHTSGNHNLKDIIYTVYGREITANLIPVSVTGEAFRVEGFIGKPVIARSNRNFENYYINGRYIKSNIINKAIEEAYKPFMMQHKYPFTMLHFKIEPEFLDVNVHPTKMELRFQNGENVFRMVRDTVAEALRHKELIPKVELVEEERARKSVPEKRIPIPEPFEQNRMMQNRAEQSEQKRQQDSAGLFDPKRLAAGGADDFVLREMPEEYRMKTRPGEQPALKATSQIRSERTGLLRTEQRVEALQREEELKNSQEVERAADGNGYRVNEALTALLKQEPGVEAAGIQSEVETQAGTGITPEAEAPLAEMSELPEAEGQMDLFEEKLLEPQSRSRHKLIGQLFATYWLVEFKDQLYIIDQHAAHEKVLYEKTMNSLKTREYTCQQIHPPIILTLGSREALMLEKNMKIFTDIGFEIEPFGGKEYAVRGVPDNLFSIARKELLMEMLDSLSEDAQARNADMIYEKVASMSCKAAVKGHDVLSAAEADALIDQLLGLENPYACPHGRPTIISMSKYELEKKFKRIV
ncbi:DNA mismatch repair endonuclease MutL [Clostridium sp. AF27-2AA]|jgi:DNA mismatch repair protein MutL|uniref:DNA mismatch repair endonuclease MutL n=1 Tax=Clostridium sp. AF27-2AA TaxID=2292206 RepID=UPI000E4E0C0B|nr:DNA mismatch repair endonuclease MutL [Clostridium sp. AF27-2AA]RHQ31940.1 DNA mismatch repair endonuclease MutL [Clostridium sp. AF27-2AA]